MALDMSEYRMPDRRLAELARQCNVLGMIEMLVAEEDDLPFQESRANVLQLLRR
jgi:hypothetical protein